MSDLIDRQAAIDALGDEPEVWSGKDEYEQGLNNQWHHDVNALKALPPAQSEPLTCDGCKHKNTLDNECKECIRIYSFLHDNYEEDHT